MGLMPEPSRMYGVPPKYFVELGPDQKLLDNVLMSCHNIHECVRGSRNPRWPRQTFCMGWGVILHRNLVPASRLAIIEGQMAEDIAKIEADIRELQYLKADAIREASMRPAHPNDFYAIGQEVPE